MGIGKEKNKKLKHVRGTLFMKIRCVWEHNGNDSILYAENFIGAFTRGASKDLAIQKMPSEIKSYLMWKGSLTTDLFEPEIVEEKHSGLTISDADSDVLFDEERIHGKRWIYVFF